MARHQGNVSELPYKTPMVREDRLISLPWLASFGTLFGAPGAFIDLSDLFPAAPDSLTFQASVPGSILIQDGTFSVVELTRGKGGRLEVTLDVSAALGTFIPMGLKDEIAFTYTVVPTSIWYIPAIGVQQGVM